MKNKSTANSMKPNPAGNIIWVFMAAMLGMLASAHAQTLVTWNGAGTAWATTTDWSPNAVPTATNNVVFNSTFTNQPALSAASTANALWLANGVGQNVTISAASAQTLTLGGTGSIVSATSGTNATTAILLDDPSNHNLTIGPNVTLAVGTESFLVDNAGTLALQGTIDIGTATAQTLTIGGTNTAGTTSISGIVANPLGGASALTINTLGSVQLSGTTNITGAVNINSGTFTETTVGSVAGGIIAVTGAGSNVTLNGVNDAAVLDTFANNSTTTLTGTIGIATISSGATFTETSAGSIGSGTGAITVASGAHATLAGATSFVTLAVQGGYTTTAGGMGSLNLDFSHATVSSNLVAKTTALALSGGMLTITGSSGEVNSQAFNSNTTFSGSAGSAYVLNLNGAASLSGSLGSITRGGQTTVDFTMPAGTSITTTTLSSSNGVMTSVAGITGVAYATMNGGGAWATDTAGAIGALAAGATGNASYATSTNNIDVTNGDAPSAFTVNTLRFNSASSTLNLTGSNSVGTGGILVSSTGAGAVITGGTLTPGGGHELLLIDYGSLNVSSVIANSTAASQVTISGTGVTTLSGANTYTGNTDVAEGTLKLGAVGTIPVANTLSVNGSGILDVAGLNLSSTGIITNNAEITSSVAGGVLTLATTGGYTGTGILSGSLQVVINAGSGNITLANANNYTGGTILNNGTLTVTGNALALGSGTLTINGGTFAGTAIFQNAEVWNGNFTDTSTKLLSGNLSPITLGASVTVIAGASIYGNQTTNATGTVTDLGYGYGLTIGVSGLGTGFMLSGNDTFTGPITVLAGTQFGSNNINSTSRSTQLNIASTGLVELNAGIIAGLTGSGSFQNATSSTALTLGGTGTYAFSGQLGNGSSSGALAVTWAGTGQQTLSGTETAKLNGLFVNAGTLVLDESTGGGMSTGQAVNLGGGTLSVKFGTTTSQTIGNLGFGVGGSTLSVTNSGGAATLTTGALVTGIGSGLQIEEPAGGGTVAITTTTATNAVGTYGAHVVYNSGGYDGSGNALVDWLTTTSGGSPYTLTNYTGYTTYSSGGGSATVNYLLPGSVTLSGSTTMATLKITDSTTGQGLNLNNSILNLQGGGILFTGSSAYTISSGSIQGDSSGATIEDLVIQNYGLGSLTVSSVIQNFPAQLSGLTVAGPGTTVLTGNNTYGGATYLSGGILNINSLAATGTGSSIVFGGGTLQYASGFTGSTDITTTTGTGIGGAGIRPVTIDAAGATIDTGTNNVAYANAIGGTITLGQANYGGLTKVGSGTLALNFAGLNNYGGVTNINGGTLKIGAGGSIASSVMTSINSGGTLLNSAGTSTFGAITLNAGGVLAMTQGGNVLSAPSSVSVSLNSQSGGLTWNGASSQVAQIDITLGSSNVINLGAWALVKGTGTIWDFNFMNSGVAGTTYDLINFNTTNFTASNFSFDASSLGGGVSTGTFTLTSGSLTFTLGAAGVVAPATAYWTGSQDGTWNSTITGGTSANFYTAVTGGTNTAALPGAATNVFFSTSSPTPANLSTTLGQNFTINSLTFNANGGAVTISGSMLTINASGTNSNTPGNGIMVQTGAASGDIINSAIALGASQTWTVTDSSNTLTVNGAISGSGFSLTTAGAGTVLLTGSESYTGATIVSSGTLQVNGSLSGSSAVTVDVATLSGTGTVNGTVALTGSSTLLSAGILDLVHGFSVGGTSNVIASGSILGNATQNAGSALQVNGTLSGSDTLANGATALNGTGTVGVVTMNGGGNVVSSTGTLATGGITVNGTNNTIGLGTVTGAITQLANSALTVTGNAGSDTLGTSATLAGTGSLGVTTLSGSDTLSSAGTLTLASLGVSGVGNQISSGTVSATNGTTVNGSSSLEVNGVLNSNVSNSGTIGGSGKINGTLTVTAGGATYPGDPQIMNQSGNLSYNAGSSAIFATGSSTTPSGLNKVKAGTDYDQIAITGSSNPVLTIGTGGSTITGSGTSTSNVSLTLNLGNGTSAIQNTVNTLKANEATSANPYIGGGSNTGLDNYYVFTLGTGTSSGYFSSLTLTDANGDLLTGTIYYSGANDRFNGISNLGDVVVQGTMDGVTIDQEYALSYTGNFATNSTINGTDIVLTAIPEPGTWGMILGGFGMLIGIQRLRKRRMGI